MRTSQFALVALSVALFVWALAHWLNNDYYFFAGYVVAQFIVLSTAWNILGGYCGYINFGTAAFFALGAYTSVVLHKLPNFAEANWSPQATALVSSVLPLPMPVLIVLGGAVSALVGLAVAYLTLRLRGVFFAIATLALAVVLQTFIVNWDYVGGSRGAYIMRPATTEFWSLNYVEYLFLLLLLLSVVAVTTARVIERSALGLGFASIRDDELAAEACGVPTLRLKLVATALSGAFMGMAGAPFPYYVGYIEPTSAFGLFYAVNAIAMPLIGGTSSWLGPLLGAVLLGSIQQIAAVTISSAASLLVVGVVLVASVIAAPHGILGWLQHFTSWGERRRRCRLGMGVKNGRGVA